MTVLKLAIFLIAIALLMKLAIWIYRRPQRKLAKLIDEAWENDPLSKR